MHDGWAMSRLDRSANAIDLSKSSVVANIKIGCQILHTDGWKEEGIDRHTDLFMDT